MSRASNHLREEYLSGTGFLGGFIYPHQEELKKSRFFLSTMEEFVADSERKEVEALEKGIESLTPEQKDEYWQWHYPVHWQEIFSNRLRASFIMQLCSLVEGELNEISHRIEIVAQVPIKVSDLRGSTLSKFRKYLEAFARLNSPRENSWDTLERIFDVRNVMVHERGFSGAYRNHTKILDFASKVPGLSLNNDHIEVKREFCEYCLQVILAFCDELHEGYESFRATQQALQNTGRVR